MLGYMLWTRDAITEWFVRSVCIKEARIPTGILTKVAVMRTDVPKNLYPFPVRPKAGSVVEHLVAFRAPVLRLIHRDFPGDWLAAKNNTAKNITMLCFISFTYVPHPRFSVTHPTGNRIRRGVMVGIYRSAGNEPVTPDPGNGKKCIRTGV